MVLTRSVVAALTLVYVPTVASLVTRWPPARWPLALARLGVPTSTSPSFPPRLLLLLLLQLLLPLLLLLLLLLQLLLDTRPVTLLSGTLRSGTLQPISHQQLFPYPAYQGPFPGPWTPVPPPPLPQSSHTTIDPPLPKHGHPSQ